MIYTAKQKRWTHLSPRPASCSTATRAVALAIAHPLVIATTSTAETTDVAAVAAMTTTIAAGTGTTSGVLAVGSGVAIETAGGRTARRETACLAPNAGVGLEAETTGGTAVEETATRARNGARATEEISTAVRERTTATDDGRTRGVGMNGAMGTADGTAAGEAASVLVAATSTAVGTAGVATEEGSDIQAPPALSAVPLAPATQNTIAFKSTPAICPTRSSDSWRRKIPAAKMPTNA